MSDDRSVTIFRMERMRRAPRNWTYWIALFSFLNGVFLILEQDFLILAGLVAPFLMDSAWPHFLAAAVFSAIAYFSVRTRSMLVLGLIVYVADALLAAYLNLWAGLIMHAVVLVLIGIALAGARNLDRQLSSACQAGDG